MRASSPRLLLFERDAARVMAGLLVLSAAILPVAAQTRVVAWGAGMIIKPSDNNDFGQSIVPAALTNAAEVAGGWRNSLALKTVATDTNGTLKGWGDDSLGQADFFPARASNYVAIACGYLHSMALQSNGVVISAGDDGYGQTDVPNDLTNVVAISCGFYHTLALKSDGTVVSWGASADIFPVGTAPNFGQTIVPPNLSNVVAVAAGGYHSLALKGDGTVIAWGRGDSGQTNVPVNLSNVVAIAAGGFHSVALKADGSVMAWGLNTYGETSVPADLSNVVAIAAGGWHTLALKADGTVQAWGAGGGSNTNVDYHQNVVPVNLTNVVQIAAGELHSLALVGSAPPVLKAPLTNPAVDTNGFSVFLPTRNGRVFRLEYKNSLNDAAWIALPLQAGTGGELELRDPGVSVGPRYYRAEQW